MNNIKSILRGCGHYLPERVISNLEFEKTLNTSDEWIKSRTGIEYRHFADEGQKTSDLAVRAAINALENANINANEIDALIVATTTPDQTFPATATRVQHEIGMKAGYAFDIQAVCAGFIFALGNADALIRAGQARRVMVIGAETFSRILDWSDRSTCVLFGDGAGAVILESSDMADKNRGLLSCKLFSDGEFNDILYVDGGVSSTQTTGFVKMQGQEVFKHAVSKLVEAGSCALDAANLTKDDVSWVVPHQANLRIIKNTVKKMAINYNKVVLTVQKHGNTSAASIPLALSTASDEKKFQKGDVILLKAIGGGLAWGAAVLGW